MAAAVITASTVQKREICSSIISGSTEKRLCELYIEGTKVTQNDWFLLSSYLSTADCSNIAQVFAIIDPETGSANVPELDTWTYTSQTAKAVLSGTTVGKARVKVLYWNE